MKPMVGLAAMGLAAVLAGGGAQAKAPPLKDPVFLNIGFVCHWQYQCMQRQQRAMQRGLAYVKRHRTPVWKVQLCNRNASRRRERVDWIGFDNCVRNRALRQAPTRTSRR